MKRGVIAPAAAIFFGLTSILYAGIEPGQAAPPNIVFLLADDLGWRDVGFAGNDFIETPHIDRLATEGIQFTQAYASAPNCAPTRACLMSGQYTPRHGVFTVVDPRHDPGQPWHRIMAAKSRESLDTNVTTIAELLRERGYSTGCIGMWNLGRGRRGPETPLGQGFDLYLQPKDFGFDRDAYFNPEGAYLTDALGEAAVQFIREHRNRPFFLYLATHAVHAPLDPKPALLDEYQKKAMAEGDRRADPAYAATVAALDEKVGRLMTTLKDLGLDRNTLVVFTSDNGGTPQYVAPLSGSKGSLYEGGLRVPCAVWWSGIARPGRTFGQPVLSMDFYPTLAELAGAPLPTSQPIDGVSLAPVLNGENALEREAVYWHFPCYVGRGKPSSAVRCGDWKLIENFEDGSFELYNLQKDPGETQDLATREREVTQKLATRLHNWQQATHAPLPEELNPDFDPSLRDRRGGRVRDPGR